MFIYNEINISRLKRFMRVNNTPPAVKVLRHTQIMFCAWFDSF